MSIILYKSLRDYKSYELNGFSFQKDDIIEYMSQLSTTLYKGRNLMTRKIGLFACDMVSKLCRLDNDREAFVVIESSINCFRGDIIYGSKTEDNNVVGHIVKDNGQVPINIPRKFLIPVYLQSPFSQIPNIGCINSAVNFTKTNRWVSLFDYDSGYPNHLKIKHGDYLQLVCKIDTNWFLMRNKSGQVGLVLFNFVRDLSIKPRTVDHPDLNQNVETLSKIRLSTENKYIHQISRIDEVPESQNIHSVTEEYDCSSIYSSINDDDKYIDTIGHVDDAPDLQNHESTTEEYVYSSIISSKYDDTDENIYEDELTMPRESTSGTNSTTVPGYVHIQFEQRENRVKKDIEVIMDNIASNKSQLYRQDSNPEYSQMISTNLAFLKEEYKQKQKQLMFIKKQKEKVLSGSVDSTDDEPYCSIYHDDDDESNKKYSTRNKVIEEILMTERNFINDLKLTVEVFDRSKMRNTISDQNYNAIFGDLAAVISMSEGFHSELSHAIDTHGIETTIGSIFLKFLPLFESVYKEYCLNYDRKLELINMKVKNKEIEEFINEGIVKMNERGTNIATIDSMLVKPLQRFFKFPLFMKILIQNTDEDHADIKNLNAALKEFERIALKINEKKRFDELRMDIFEQNEHWPLRTWHALQKVPKRLIAVSMYGVQQDDDSDYDNQAKQFKRLTKFVSFFMEILLILRDNLKEILVKYSDITGSLARIVTSSCGTQLYQYTLLCKNGDSNFFTNYVLALDSTVINPIRKLLFLFNGTELLIKKRKSKLLDYQLMKQKLEAKEITREQTDRIEELKNIYFAINNTLKEELPILVSKSSVIFNECISNYLLLTTTIHQDTISGISNTLVRGAQSIQRELTNCTNEQTELIDKIQRNVRAHNFIEEINSVDCFVPNHQLNTTDSVCRTEYYCQTDEDIAKLKSKFNPKDVVRVKKAFIPTKSHQIQVSVGNVVGVLKRSDEKGNNNNWVVEVCPKRIGFVPKSCLNTEPFIQRRQSDMPFSSTLSRKYGYVDKRYSTVDCNSDIDLMQFAPNTPLPTDNPTSSGVSFKEIRIGLYNFKSSGPSEIAMQKNDKVELIESHDTTGNPSWSLVRNIRTGAQGYVPSNYISNESR